MGNFYVNYTLVGPSQDEVVALLSGRRAAVTPPRDECVVVFDEQSDSQAIEVIADLASGLSDRLSCPLVAVLNHDDDVLKVYLYDRGEFLDEYDSNPGYFDFDSMKDFDWSGVESLEDMQAQMEKMPPPPGPSGGDSKKFVSVLGRGDASAVETVLRRPSAGDGGYVFAFERHHELVKALELPACAVGTAFASFERDEYPEGLSAADLVLTN